ncbi:hypothetical protein ANCCEY_11826 [Ancylostoma ceylanicum]|uniref:Proteolipid membrane potential modulator n=1 Tax=Ancylostoma ceylanicum TaxID=53326 RepID=A0A0D6LB28_9BILA|nr:hypothetical protein ANCCEY_11826 [Ancylostoma ceylanicum]
MLTFAIPVKEQCEHHSDCLEDMGSSDTDKIIEILLILLLPPLAVWFHDRACSCAVCINIILLFLFVLPAIIHAVWYCYMRD